MAVEVVFQSAQLPQDHLVWKAIAEAVLGTRNACVVARQTDAGWDISLQGVESDGFSTIAHHHSDGDFEAELHRALRAAGVVVVRR